MGRRVRLSALVRTAEVTARAGRWMRIHGADPSAGRVYDDMADRPLIGTTPWRHYSVELDVPDGATRVGFGAHLAGAGTVWVADLRLEAVGHLARIPGTHSASLT